VKQLKNQKFVCIDCETTGLDPKEDRVIEVAALCFDGESSFEQYESLIDPECVIPDSAIAIHHITQEMVQGKPKIQAVLSEILSLIADHIIIGHGVGFDIELLAVAAERHGITSTIRQNPRIDTLRLARLYDGCPVNSLEMLR
jgi:DNA polymerase-3 subunit epsilon